jgi:carboxyl-terminal processing protease
VRLGRALPVLTALALSACAGWPGGIHAVLRYRPAERALFIERVPANGAAARAGLQPGDEVVAIDGEPVSAMSEEALRARLRGEVGTHVRLRVRRDGAEREVDIERAPYRN